MPENEPKMRVIILSHGQCEAALERLLALDGVAVVGVFVETDILRRYSPREAFRRSVKYEGWGVTFRNYAQKLLGLGNSYDADVTAMAQSRERLRKAAEAHNVPIHFVSDFHKDETIALIRQASPDLGVIYGTNIIREQAFRIPRLGSINMHQGLAPFYRGGPPIFWELYNGELEVGITVHFVETKVDSGAIVLQETVPLVYDYAHGLYYKGFIAEFSQSLRERCAFLVAESVRMIAEGSASPKPQDALLGKRYRLPTKVEKDELRRRLRQRRRKEQEANRSRGFEIHRDARRTDEASSA